MPEITDPGFFGTNAAGVATGPRPAASQRGSVRTVYTAPEDPTKAATAGADLEKKYLDIEGARLENERKARENAEKEKELAVTGGVKTAENEKTAGYLTTRLTGAMQDIQRVLKEEPDAEKPGMFSSAVGALLGEKAERRVTSDARKRIEDAQKVALDSALTLGTGAAYTAEQLENLRTSLFPVFDDSPEVIADKRRRFLREIEAGRVKAGAAAPAVDQALSAVDAIFGPEKTTRNVSEEGLDAFIPSSREEFEKKRKDEEAAGGFAVNPETYEEYLDRIGGDPKQRDTAVGAVDAAVRGAADVVTLGLADEIAAYAQSKTGGGSFEENLARERAVDRADEQVNPWARTGGQIAAGFALPSFGARSPGAIGALGAGYSGGYGAGSATGDLRNRLGGAARAAPVGFLAGYGAGKVIDKFRGSGTADAAAGSPIETYQAARRQNIDLLPADVGGPITRGSTAVARQGIVSEFPIAARVEKAVAGGEAARTKASEAAGTVLSEVDAGELVRKAANVYSKDTSAKGSALYTRAFNKSGDTSLPLPKALQAVDEKIALLERTPNGENTALYGELVKMRNALANKSFGIDGLRNWRTSLREDATFKGLRGNTTTKMYGDILDKAADDIADGLKAAGKDDAAAAFRTADDFWKKRVETIDEVLDPILGKNTPRSGEQIFQSLQNMANAKGGDSKRLARLMNALPENEANNIRASVIQKLGEARPSAQDAEGAAFSFETFLTRWNQMSPEAKSTMFLGESRKTLDDLAKIASGARATRAYENKSNTTRGIAGQALLAGVGSAVFDAGALLGIGAAQGLTGLVLSSPKATRALVAIAKAKSPAARAKAVSGLGEIAAREPAIANDLTRLTEALSQSPGRAAAGDNEQQRR